MSEGFWWIALAIAAASAGAHLATMLGTRWGDRGASSKALLFSLLTHAALFCALFAVEPELERLGKTPDEPQEHTEPLMVNEVLPNAVENLPSPELGNAPAWDRPAERMKTPEDRLDRPVDLPAADETARTVDEIPPADRDVPSVVELPEPSLSAPDRVDAATPEVLTQTPQAPIVDQETAEARSAESLPLARTDLTPAGEANEGEVVERSAAPPSVTVADDLNSRQEPLELVPSEGPAELAALDAENDSLRLERPSVPVPLPNDEVTGIEESEGTPGDAGLSPRFSRRSLPSQSFAGSSPTGERTASPAEPLEPTRREIALSSTDRLGPSPTSAPSLSRPDASPLTERRKNAVPETYQLRALDRRSDIARRHGGTEASEQAVELSLKWLAAHQHPAGYWDADAYGAGQVGIDEEGVNRRHAGKTADSGLTALALLAFLGAGYTQEEGEYADTIEKALTWLVENQRDDGFLGGDAAHFEQMYCHGMATYALAEAYGMQGDETNVRLRRPLFNAVLYIAAQQGEDGGWRYVKGQDGDMSMFGWQLMALKSAEIAGIPMPGTTRTKMIRFLKDRSLGESGGLAAYREGLQATPPMTAEALFCKQMLGMTRTNPASVEAVNYLLKSPPKRSELNYYYWYYGTLAMYQYGGTAWDRWNSSLRDLLIAEQVKEGEDAGSWAPRDQWGPYGGRIYSTAIATLSLEVYYRFLPLYRAGEIDAVRDERQ